MELGLTVVIGASLVAEPDSVMETVDCSELVESCGASVDEKLEGINAGVCETCELVFGSEDVDTTVGLVVVDRKLIGSSVVEALA